MARMIPPVISRDHSSFGEVQVFNKLKDEPGTKDWIVLHSYNLPEHIRQQSGEIDFVVIIPNKGILCIEVKGCSDVVRREGLWFYGPNSRGEARGPFKQVNDNMHSLRQRIAKEKSHLSRIPIFTAVIFPLAKFDEISTEWHSWEVVDKRKMRASTLSGILNDLINKWRDHTALTSTSKWFEKESSEPYPQQCSEVASYLRGDFEKHEDAKSIIERNQYDLERFTTEQFDALDSMEGNSKIIFSGAAGTGKTYLALEAAKRASLRFKKVLFVCFNKNLSELIHEKCESFKNVEVMTIHSLMLKWAKCVVDDSNPFFWDKILPEKAQNAFINDCDFEKDLYDMIIIDEGQDLLHPSYLDFLELIMVGGFSSGKWQMFGDFVNQAIYKPKSDLLNDFKAAKCGGVVEYRLTINCRNSRSIGTWAEKFGKLNPGYSRFRRPEDGLVPELNFYKQGDNVSDKILEKLNSLEAEGFRNKDIVALSPYSFDRSAISSIKNSTWKDRLKPYKHKNQGYLSFSTIQAFKGLESQIIILTDFDKLDSDEHLALLYIAISRAIHKLILFVDQDLKQKLSDVLMSFKDTK